MDTPPVVKGFVFAGLASGLKKNGKKDLGLMVSDPPASVAGVFTTNQVKAAPVVLDQVRVRSGLCRAVVANSGCANCCTGEPGMEDARQITAEVAGLLQAKEETVLCASTGVIGERLDKEKIRAALPGLVDALSPEGLMDFARAIMTTDTRPKVAARTFEADGKTCTLAGVIKGAGMIRPDMATMLCFLATDAKAGPEFLGPLLEKTAGTTFNRATIDGDTSTNDTVLLMANGASGLDAEVHEEAFVRTLEDICRDLTRQMVADGEGVTKVFEVKVKGCASDRDAQKIADTVAHSPLVKTAAFGEDANWGRLFMAAGRAGVVFDQNKVDLYFDGVQMVKNGRGLGMEAEKQATLVLKKPEFTITLDFHAGPGQAKMLSCDLSLDYVSINADYRS